MTRPDLRLVVPATAAWAAATLAVLVPAAAAAVVIGGVALAGLVVLAATRERRRGVRSRARASTPSRGGPRAVLRRSLGGTAGLAVVGLCVGAAVAFSSLLQQPARDAAASWDGTRVTVTAQVSSSASIGSDGRLWFDAQATRIGPADAQEAADAPVRIGVESEEPRGGYDLGARVTVRGQVMATDADERAALVVFGDDAEIAEPAGGVFAVAAGVRADFIERAVALPEPGAGLLPGLAVGDTRAVSDELNAAMITSGLSHLTAVSGANCALVVGAVFWIVSLCGGGRLLRAVLSLAALAAFVVLVTPEPSVVRAAVMAGLAMLTVMLGRPSAGTGVLCLAVVGILGADPWLALTPGFALSVVATAALLLLARPLARGLERWMPAPIALAIAVPLAAQLACGPIIALFAPQQSVIGVAANILAAPAAPIATVIGLLACLATTLAPVADVLAAAAWLPSAWIATTATTSAALPFAEILVPAGPVSALLVAAVSLAAGILLVRGRSGASPPPRWRTGAALLLAVVTALGGARMLLDGPLATATAPADWSIAVCDVGQGDATLLRSQGQVMLVDTGEDEALLERCLRSLGIAHIDMLVLTHFDADHVGAAEALVGRVGALLHGPPDGVADERIVAAFRAAGAATAEGRQGMTGMLGAARWEVLWPRRASAAFPAGNDASVVVGIGGGGMPSTLLLGDLSAVPQRLLAADPAARRTFSVVKVSHHGSADQDAGLYAGVRPAVALIGVGAGNDYGHPRAETLALLEAAGAAVLRTDRHGRILLAVRDGDLVVWTERDDVPGPD